MHALRNSSQVIRIVKYFVLFTLKLVCQVINVSIEEYWGENPTLQNASGDRDRVISRVRRRDAIPLVYELDCVCQVSREPCLVQLVSKQNCVVACVESTFKVKEDYCRPSTALTTLPSVICQTSFNYELQNINFATGFRLKASLGVVQRAYCTISQVLLYSSVQYNFNQLEKDRGDADGSKVVQKVPLFNIQRFFQDKDQSRGQMSLRNCLKFQPTIQQIGEVLGHNLQCQWHLEFALITQLSSCQAEIP